jgi:hypothetical protein
MITLQITIPSFNQSFTRPPEDVMKRNYSLFPWYFGALAALLGSAWLLWGPAWGAVSEPPKVQLQEAYGKLPLHFIHNQGQVDERVQFYTQGGGYAFFFTREGVVLSLARDAGKSNENRTPGPRTAPGRQGPRAVVQLQPVGLGPGVVVAAADPQAGKVNYFIGNDPKKWHTNIATYGAVVYREAYPGIDLKFYGNGRQLEYDVVVKPGADPGRVKFQYQGIKGLAVTREGDLAIQLPDGGSLTQKKPVVYQEIAGRRVAREGKFKLLDEPAGDTYGFEVAAYDPRYPLVIDPTLEYATYLGGRYWDVGYGIAVDAEGCAYVTGYTYSGNFPLEPTYNAHITSGITSAIFVTKINKDGTGLDYSTFLGGGTLIDRYDNGQPINEFNDDNYGYAIAVDETGCAYVTGGTMSANFPTKNEIQAFRKGYWDAVVFKLSPDGSELIYSTFLGGSSLDIGRGIAVGIAVGNAANDHDVFVTGKTFSIDFPKKNPSQGNNGGGGDAFVARLHFDESSLSLVYSTYLGGSGDDAGNGIAVDSAGNAYVAGATNSKNFPTTYKAGQTGDYDAFVTKFSYNNSTQQLSLGYSVRLGGSKYDSGEAMAVFTDTTDSKTYAYVTGYTYSGTGFPTTNTLYSAGVAAAETARVSAKASSKGKGGGSQTGTDAFVTKINADGKSLGYSLRLGGSNYDYGYGIAVDSSGCAYVTGETSSADFPLVLPLAGNGGGREVFVTKLNPAGSGAFYSTYLRGNDDDVGFAIAVFTDNSNPLPKTYAYVTGYTYSTDFSTLGAFQKTLNQHQDGEPYYGNFYDAFVAKIGP